VIALYQGKSVISRAIRVFNWSDYSHAAWMDPADGTIIEAWHRGGVSHVPAFSTNHTPGTRVELYGVTGETPEQTAIIRAFLLDQVGKSYDYLGIMGFVFRSPRLHSKRRWFCSELVAEAYATAGLPLLRLPAFKVYPGMLAASPMLKHIAGIVTS